MGQPDKALLLPAGQQPTHVHWRRYRFHRRSDRTIRWGRERTWLVNGRNLSAARDGIRVFQVRDGS